MTSADEITKRIIEAVLSGKDVAEIAVNYMQELLFDMGNRYSMSNITLPIVAAAFKVQADVLCSRLEAQGKDLFNDLVSATADSDVHEIRFPGKFKSNKED